ncbi:MAG: bifunctional 5,10-methylenetetrahydrofolate dehydrogenase/5,10-methenyltetrahydrofolate cyclohydrolase [Acidobacteria bacterium]|nr:MAG: bifunctional 5,10-methylenetetrahydrofolate dehydrogenase/5,10-methenyltetrahydrofolate cyclohydrolase [Acidobacteriota bacterium]
MAEKPAAEAARGRLLDGRAVARAMREDVARRVAALVAGGGRPPRLVAVLVGDDPASRAYVGSKTRASAEVGIAGETRRLPAAVEQRELLATVAELADDDEVDGILVQLPLPRHLEAPAVLEAVPPAKDVDGFHPENVGRLWLDQPGLTPATPTGVIELLRRYRIPLAGRHAVVVGRSAIVGKPMAALLLRQHCTVTLCHSRTRDLAAACRQGELLVAAAGRAGLIGPRHVRDGAVVIDVGMNRVDDPQRMEELFPGDAGRRARFAKRGYVLAGDVDFARVAPRASWITPVPGGVGPLTVAQLLVNTLEASLRRQGFAP